MSGDGGRLAVRTEDGLVQIFTSGPPLGLLAAAGYQAHATAMEPGDLLLVYTDGITEPADPDDEEFGLQRLEDLARRHRAAPLAELQREIERALDEFVRGVPYADDRTMLFLRRQPS